MSKPLSAYIFGLLSGCVIIGLAVAFFREATMISVFALRIRLY